MTAMSSPKTTALIVFLPSSRGRLFPLLNHRDKPISVVPEIVIVYQKFTCSDVHGENITNHSTAAADAASIR